MKNEGIDRYLDQVKKTLDTLDRQDRTSSPTRS